KRTGMHSDLTEIVTEARFHEPAELGVERLSAVHAQPVQRQLRSRSVSCFLGIRAFPYRWCHAAPNRQRSGPRSVDRGTAGRPAGTRSDIACGCNSGPALRKAHDLIREPVSFAFAAIVRISDLAISLQPERPLSAAAGALSGP